jgi:dipeptidyl aminopeptidase/acylaminoacyl peptidase
MKKNVSNFNGNLMKILSLTIVLAFIAPLMTNAQSGKANFAGTWTFNTEKSTQPPAGGGRGFGGSNFVATQDANSLTVVRTRTGQDGTATTVTSKYTLDGKESVNTTPRGTSKSVATWSADGKSLTIVTSANFNGNEMKSSQVWTLTAPKTLSITSTRNGQNGEVKTTQIYEIK